MGFPGLPQSSFKINMHISFYHIIEVVTLHIQYIIYTVLMYYTLHWLVLHLLQLFLCKAFFDGAINFFKPSKKFYKTDYALHLFVYKVSFEGAINLFKLSNK